MSKQPHQTYYAMTHAASVQASEAMWAEDAAAERSPTAISFFFVGTDGWIWANDPERHALLAACMDRLAIPFTVTETRGTHPFVEGWL